MLKRFATALRGVRGKPPDSPVMEVQERMARLGTWVLVAGWVALLLSPWGGEGEHGKQVLLVGLASVGLLWGGIWGLRRLRYQGDPYLWPLMGLLMAWGMLIQTRLGSFQFHEGIRLYMWAYVGVLPIFWAMVLLRGRGLRVLRGLHVLAAVGAGLFMYWLVLKGGTTFRGARFGPLLTTPSEALKLLLVIYLAGYLTRRVERGFEGVLGARLVGEGLLFVALWSIPQVMFLIQRDLGVIVLFGVLLIVMFFVATGRPGYLYGGAVITGFSAAVLYDLFPHVHARWEAWLNPWADPRGRGWQTLQALFALRAGWLDGSGLGNGYPHVIPIVASDFVYAALAEEMGLWGCAMILLTFSVLFWRGWRIAERAETTFNRFLALGLTTLLATQTFVNLAGVLRVLPITGLTLPFLSRGGSSLLVSTAMVGLLAAISDAREPSTEEE